MNSIVTMYQHLRDIGTFEDLVRVLVSEYGMPYLRRYEAPNLLRQCEMVAQDWVRYQYASQLRQRETVSDIELRGAIGCVTLEFYAVLRAGDVKTLYLVRPDASDFIMATAFTQKLEPEFFISNFKVPLVLYSGEPKTLFDDVLCIEVFYNEEQRTLECLVSCADETLPSREFSRAIPIEVLSGEFTVDLIAQEDAGENALFMIRQGLINSVSELDEKFYEAIRYALKFVLLRESDKQPLLVERQYKKGNEIKERQIFGKLNHQRISLTTAYRNASRSRNADNTLVLDKEGKTLRGIFVRGFVRRQHYGPENSLVKTIYIDAHESHSWMKEGIRIVHVVK